MANKWMPKKGEPVLCIESHVGQFTKNKIYIVREDFRTDSRSGYNSSMLYIEKDDGNENNGWQIMRFRPATKAAKVLFGEISDENT